MKLYDFSVPFPEHTTRLILKELANDADGCFCGEVYENVFSLLWRKSRFHRPYRVSLEGEFHETLYGTHVHMRAGQSRSNKIVIVGFLLVQLFILSFFLVPDITDALEVLIVLLIFDLLYIGIECISFRLSCKKAMADFIKRFEAQKI